jgi:hypothetical protein
MALNPFTLRSDPKRSEKKLSRVLYVRKENDLKTVGAISATIYFAIGGDQIRFVCSMYCTVNYTLCREQRKLFNSVTS